MAQVGSYNLTVFVVWLYWGAAKNNTHTHTKEQKKQGGCKKKRFATILRVVEFIHAQLAAGPRVR